MFDDLPLTGPGPSSEYFDGLMAYQRGHRSNFNPYDLKSREYADWRNGWIDAALCDALLGSLISRRFHP